MFEEGCGENSIYNRDGNWVWFEKSDCDIRKKAFCGS